MLARAVAVHDDDLVGAGSFRAAHGGVDLLRVEVTTFVIGGVRRGAVGLRPLDDPRDALHVADDEDLHGCVAFHGWRRGLRTNVSSSRAHRAESAPRARVRLRAKVRRSRSTTTADATAPMRSRRNSGARLSLTETSRKRLTSTGCSTLRVRRWDGSTSVPRS